MERLKIPAELNLGAEIEDREAAIFASLYFRTGGDIHAVAIGQQPGDFGFVDFWSKLRFAPDSVFAPEHTFSGACPKAMPCVFGEARDLVHTAASLIGLGEIGERHTVEATETGACRQPEVTIVGLTNAANGRVREAVRHVPFRVLVLRGRAQRIEGAQGRDQDEKENARQA